MRRSRVAIILMAALLLFAGCGTTTTSTSGANTSASAGAASKLCQRLATINQSLTQLSTVGDNTTVGEVKAAQQKITDALAALGRLPGEGTALSSLQAANDQLAAAIKDQPDSATMGQVSVKLQDFKGKVTQAQTAATKLSSVLKCGS